MSHGRDKQQNTVGASRPLWRCPRCGARLVTRNMWHSCGRFTLDPLFRRSEPHVLRLFKSLERMVRQCGPVTMIPQKTRVVFMVRVRFAAAYPRKASLLVGLGLPRLVKSPRIRKAEVYARHFIGHMVEIRSAGDLDDVFRGWLREAYLVGEQRFANRPGPAGKHRRRH